MKNKRAKQMLSDVLGCDIGYWERLKIFYSTPIDEIDESYSAFYRRSRKAGLTRFISLTANQLKDI